MKIYIITATYCLNANGCEIEFEEFIDMFTGKRLKWFQEENRQIFYRGS